MRLVCPACGAIASLEIWSLDPAAREVIDIISKLPGCIANRAPAYLALFRRGKRGLTWARALKIIVDLQQLVMTGKVHWEGEEERPAPPELWAQIIDKMLVKKWDPPLEDHNYLRKVVWSEAKPLAVAAEAGHRSQRPEGEHDASTLRPPSSVPRKRGCFSCDWFRPPKSCAAKARPISGNQMLGCELWKEKAASSSVGELFSGLVADLPEGGGVD
jgi:hypothetical protein